MKKEQKNKDRLRVIFTNALNNRVSLSKEAIDEISSYDTSLAMMFVFASWLNKGSTSRGKCEITISGLAKRFGCARSTMQTAIGLFNGLVMRTEPDPRFLNGKWVLCEDFETEIQAFQTQAEIKEGKAKAKKETPKAKETTSTRLKFKEIEKKLTKYASTLEVFEPSEVFYTALELMNIPVRRMTKDGPSIKRIQSVSVADKETIVLFVKKYAEVLDNLKTIQVDATYMGTFADFVCDEVNIREVQNILAEAEKLIPKHETFGNNSNLSEFRSILEVHDVETAIEHFIVSILDQEIADDDYDLGTKGEAYKYYKWREGRGGFRAFCSDSIKEWKETTKQKEVAVVLKGDTK